MYWVKKEEKEEDKNYRNIRFNTLENKYPKNYDMIKSSKIIDGRKMTDKPVEIKLEKDIIRNKIEK